MGQTEIPEHLGATNPILDRIALVSRYVELQGSFRLALDNRYALGYLVSDNEIGDVESDEVAAGRLTVDRQVEHRMMPDVARQFEPSTNGPYLLWK